MVWNFGNHEVNLFRSMNFDAYAGDSDENKEKPRYINQIQSFDFRLNTVNIVFQAKGLY